MAGAIPFIQMGISAVQGKVQGNIDEAKGNFDAAQRKIEGQAAMDQATQQEAQQRQISREQLGKQAAAIGAAGIGYGGSSQGVMKQSAINEELDALNVRYRGAFTKYGYDVESDLAKWEGKVKKTNDYIMAAGEILKSYGSSKGMG